MKRFEEKTGSPLGVGSVPAMRAPSGEWARSVPDLSSVSLGTDKFMTGLAEVGTVLARVQREKDDLELSTTGRIAAADMRSLIPTMDEKADNERLQQMKSRYLGMIRDNGNLSASARDNGIQMMTSAFEARQIELSGQRMRMIVNMNIDNHERGLKESVSNGNFYDARIHREHLERLGVSTPDLNAIAHQCNFNTMVRELNDMTAQELHRLVSDQKEKGSSYSVEGLTESGSAAYALQARKLLDQREREYESSVLASLAKGEAPFTAAQLQASWENGEVSDQSFARIKGWIDHFTAAQERSEATRKTEREKSEKALRVQRLNQWEYETFYNDYGKRVLLDDNAYSKAYKKLISICGKDYDAITERLKLLNDNRRKADGAKDPDYQKGPLYQFGTMKLKNMKSAGLLALEKGLLWGENKSKEKELPAMQLMQMKLEDFCMQFPNATAEQLDKAMNEWQQGIVRNDVEAIASEMLNLWQVRSGKRKTQGLKASDASSSEKVFEGKTGTYKGRKVIFKNGKWEYAR